MLVQTKVINCYFFQFDRSLDCTTSSSPPHFPPSYHHPQTYPEVGNNSYLPHPQPQRGGGGHYPYYNYQQPGSGSYHQDQPGSGSFHQDRSGAGGSGYPDSTSGDQADIDSGKNKWKSKCFITWTCNF